MSKAFVFINGLEVEAHYDFFGGWPGSLEEPPEPDHVDVYGIVIDGVPMQDYLTDAFLELVEEAVMQYRVDNGE